MEGNGDGSELEGMNCRAPLGWGRTRTTSHRNMDMGMSRDWIHELM